ncbi:DNA-binding PadR family transcriptional regulator [Nocardiopsis sp. Huas11]|uniref:PadR family transcriptional regulator n=1 Tax=Nocardiopsis sp. Huas11 TaxID=2183912 RepID=UPI000EAC42B1|nr:PadR family transcriptional regulator [Nocardiopsis sp. Huas11]RKS05282.1 DNA-binding PadR family transcriptional regulator [Nocardiopsis sp. Huas11]
MSTIFGHGRLRLYLLKLLDESPRHGYEIISLLRDRFLGVYSPSPGTIYPRLARLEEEGLVTHTEEGGRKVYSLTDKGRAELRERSGDLDDLEREITDSVRDIARAVKQDVRATISSLREELKFAAGGVRRSEPESADPGPGQDRAKEEQASANASDTSEQTGEGGSEQGKDGDRGRCGPEGSPWAREWERFAQGFGAFGAVWGRGDSERQGAPEFDQALRDFSERVRDVTREAGHVGEAAARDLRRILDDTIEVIRKDMRHWGPVRDEKEGPEAAPGDTPPSSDTETPAPAPEADAPSDTGAPDQGTEAPEATPMPPSGGSGGSGDPWSEAVDHPERPGEDK